MLKKQHKATKNQRHIKFFALICVVLVIIMSFNIVKQLNGNSLKSQMEKLKEISYQVSEINGKIANVVINLNSEVGIDKVTYTNYEGQVCIISGNKKQQIAFDDKMKDFTTYSYNVEYSNGSKKTLTIEFELPRIKGNYALHDGIYVNEPDIGTGWDKTKTRFLYLDENENLVPGNWLNGEQPSKWYNYNEQNWANVYSENEGSATYYVWIPRYCYKLDSSAQRSDIKFINIYDEYIDGITGEKTTWEELEQQGYQIPEAFTFGAQFREDTIGEKLNVLIPGYWMSKYQLNEVENYIIDFSAVVNLNSIEVANIKINTSETVAKITYALDGVIYSEQDSSSTGYVFENIETGNKVVNVTALNEVGEIVGSMTRTMELATPNAPDVSAFNPDTTFYVYWDNNGNEHNEIPINMQAPDNWYNYSTAKWANIVTRNDGLETYYVWIPRYQYKLNQINQRTYVKFIEGTGDKADNEYQIPEAFTFAGKELTGYWITKYQISQEDSTPMVNVEMSAGSNLIRLKDITGALITQAETDGTSLKYEYYINGEKKHEGTSSTENYVFEGLSANTTYTINVIARNSATDEYIGACTKKITTNDANVPDISSFDKETTFYVYYEGDEEKRKSIKEDPPSNWYDYSNQLWANIVTTANDTETYFTWIPRYEYKIFANRENLDKSNRRIDITFITTDITNSNCSTGYQVPEAFTFAGKELPGYWISKYQLN